MKTFLMVVGGLAALYTVTGVLMFIQKMALGAPPDLIAASAVPPIVGLIVSVLCFQKASGKS